MVHENIQNLVDNIIENRFIDTDLQVEMCDDLYDMASECQNRELMGTALFYKGETVILSDPDEAEKYVHACIPLLKDNNFELLSRAYNLLGIVANNREDIANSLDYYLKCFDICQKHGIDYVKGLCSCNIGVIFQLLEEHEKATEYFNIALDSFSGDKSENGKKNVVTININLFIDYFNLHDIPMMRKCLDYIKANRDYLETQFSVELFEAEMMYISGETKDLDETLRLAVEEAKCQDMIIEFIDSYDMLCDFLHDLGKFDMLLEVLDILEVEMKNFYMPRIRIKLIKHRLECIKADRDFDEYRRWTEEYIKTYELITKNYYQSVLNSIQLRIYIEKLKNSEQTYEKMAIRDGLTQLYNRAGLRKKADKLLQKAAQENQVIGVDIIDIDFFKQVNDSYGHVYGDDCLKSVADILKECCRRNRAGKKNEAIVSRYGGDEFVVFVRNTSEAEMRKFAADVKSELAKANIESNKSPISDLVTLSQGIACKKADKSDDVRKIIDSADKALYEVKENGRNGYKLINNV